MDEPPTPYVEIEAGIAKDLAGTQLVAVHWVAYADVLDVASGDRSVRRIVGDGTPDYLAEYLAGIYDDGQGSDVPEDDDDES